MKLYYYKSPEGNFGDDLNTWLWPKVLPGLLDDDPSAYFLGIGTILNAYTASQLPARAVKYVVGTGLGYPPLPFPYDSNWRFLSVRGPRTADLLGLDSDTVTTDSACLTALVAEPTMKVYDTSIMFHYASLDWYDWAPLCERYGFNFIDPRWPVDEVLDAILRSKVLLTEAMHGAIVADCLRVPWVPIVSYPAIHQFKWHDWCESLELPYKPAQVWPMWEKNSNGPLKAVSHGVKCRLVGRALERIRRNVTPQLSSAGKLGCAMRRLVTCLSAFEEYCTPAVVSAECAEAIRRHSSSASEQPVIFGTH